VVFTLQSAIGNIAYHNKAVIYDLLFTASAETMLTIAADPKHLGARIGFTSLFVASKYPSEISKRRLARDRAGAGGLDWRRPDRLRALAL
jgi:hypothetical protein